MSLVIKRDVAAGDVRVWQNVFETASGGFTLDTTGLTTLAAGAVLKAGLPVGFDEATRKARVIKLAVLFENEADNETAYKVLKGHNLITGEFLSAAVGGASYAISGINTSNADYDVVTLGTTLGVTLTAGTPLFQSAASGATAGAYIVAPRGLLYEDTTPAANESLSVVIRGTVYARRIPTVPAAIRTLIPNIIFSESY